MAVDRPFCPSCGQPGAPLAEGTVLHGAYSITARLAVSATGSVYSARHQRRKRDVAIKELLAPAGSPAAESAALAARFTHLARHLAHLKHPSLPAVFEGFVQDGRFYLAMELLPGSDLQAQMQERRNGFPERQVRDWILRLLDLLDYLQSRHPPFVFGEIAPSHLMLREDGTPCLIGFGLAPRLGLRPYLALPGQSAVALPPAQNKRQAAKAVPPGPGMRDDLYALGATTHELLTGRDLFAGAAEAERPYPPIHDIAPRVSVGLSEVVGQATAPDPRRRFAAPTPFRAAVLALQPVTGAMPAARSMPNASARQRQSGGLGRVFGLALLVGALVIIGSLALYTRQNTAQQHPASSAAAPGEVNPLAGSPLPIPAHTTPLSDTFVRATREWPAAPGPAYLAGSELWLDNLHGSGPLKVTRASYSTGSTGFTLRATLRLAQGGDAAYGVVAADRSGQAWENLALLVRADGSWALLRYHGGHAPALVAWQHSAAVRKGHNAPNELSLTVVPGRAGRIGSISATINGHRVATGLPAWSAASAGRVGMMAAPGVLVVCDSLAVGPPSAPRPSLEDHFQGAGAAWSAGGTGSSALRTGGTLRLRSTPTHLWVQATAPGFGPGPSATSFTEEATLTLHAPGGGWGGVLFAAQPAGTGSAALAAAVDGTGRAAIVSPGPGDARVLRSAAAPGWVRTGYGLNMLRVSVQVARGTLNVRVMVNGATVLRYTGPAQAMAPAAGIVAAGPSAVVTASALRVWD